MLTREPNSLTSKVQSPNSHRPHLKVKRQGTVEAGDSSLTADENADLRENSHRKDHHS